MTLSNFIVGMYTRGDPRWLCLSYQQVLRRSRGHFNFSSVRPHIMAAKFTPPASPPSPSASYYDVSDEDEDEYNTIAHAQSRKGVKLLYSKSKVLPSYLISRYPQPGSS